MKRTLAMILALVMLLALCACGNTETPTPAENPAPAGETTDTPAGIAPPSICIVVGNASDKSFSESCANGAKLCEEKFGCKTKVVEYGTDETKVLPTVEDLSDSDWDIIVLAGYANLEVIQQCAVKYPEQKYILFDQQMEKSYPNVYSADYKGNEGAFLTGALAAMVTTASTDEMPYANPEKVVGWVGGMDMTLINDFTLGFIQGAHYIDPEVKVITAYTNSFSDTAKGKELANIMYQSGCDIIYNGAGGAGMGCLEAGKENKNYSIGTDSDQAMLFADDPDKANLILASQLKSLDQNLVSVVERYMAGEEVFGLNENLGLADGVICLADNDFYKMNVPQWMRDKVEELTQKVKSGEIVVDTAYGMDGDAVHAIIDSARP